MVVRLPTELFSKILSHCDVETLIAASMASRSLNPLAISFLYRRILPLDVRRTLLLLWTLAQSQFCASHVLIFHIKAPFTLIQDVFSMPDSMPPGGVPSNGRWAEKMGFWTERVRNSLDHNQKQRPMTLPEPIELFFNRGMEHSFPLSLIEAAFNNMTRLDTLVVHAPSHPLLWSFTASIPTLRSVKIHKNADSFLLLFWLAKQRSLSSISYLLEPWYKKKFPEGGPEKEPHVFPQLETIHSNIRGLLAWLPNRPVSEIALDIEKDDAILLSDGSVLNETSWATEKWSMDSIASALKQSIRPIRKFSLTVTNNAILARFLPVFLEALPLLDYFKLSADNNTVCPSYLVRNAISKLAYRNFMTR